MKKTTHLYTILYLILFNSILSVGQDFVRPAELNETVIGLNTDVSTLKENLKNKQNELKDFTRSSVDYLNNILKLQQSVIELETHKKNLKKDEEKNKIDSQIKDLKNVIQTNQESFNKISRLESEVQDINIQLENKTKYLRFLRNSQELYDAAERQSAEKALETAQKVIDDEKEARDDFLKSEILLLVGNVEAWSSMTTNYKLLALSSESLLLFSEKTNRKLMKFLRNGGTDILALVSGIFAYDNFKDDNMQNGVLLVAGGILTKLIPSMLKDKKTIETYEAITRNVAFHDQIIQFNQLGSNLNAKVELLDQSIKKVQRINYRPSENDLLIYREIITTLTELQFQNLELKNRAEFLLDLAKSNDHNLSEKGNEYLTTIIDIYNDSIENQNNLTTIFINRYDLLKSALDTGELLNLDN